MARGKKGKKRGTKAAEEAMDRIAPRGLGSVLGHVPTGPVPTGPVPGVKKKRRKRGKGRFRGTPERG